VNKGKEATRPCLAGLPCTAVHGDDLSHLDARSLAHFELNDERLIALCLSIAHVTLALEEQGEAEPQNALYRHEMQITHTTAEQTN